MSSKIVIKNSGASDLEFWLEPWGDGASVPVESNATVQFASNEDLDRAVGDAPGRVSLWVERGSPNEVSGRMFVISQAEPPRRPAETGAEDE